MRVIASAPNAVPEAPEEVAKKQSVMQRTISTIVMIGSFAFIIWTGHVLIMFLTLGLLFFVYREVMDIGYNQQRDKKPPNSWIQWYVCARRACSCLHPSTLLQLSHGVRRWFFVAGVWFVYGRATSKQAVETFGVDYHLLMGFLMFMGGVVLTVCSASSLNSH